MGPGKKNKGGDDEEAGLQNVRRRPGESGEDLIARLAGDQHRQQQCGTCRGNQTVKVKREKDLGRGRVKMVENIETCKTCRGTGWISGRVR